LKKDRTVAAVCHSYTGLTDQRRVALDRMATWQGSRLRPVHLADVEAWIAQASGAYGRAEVVLDPWQAVGMAQRLRERGIKVTEHAFTAQSVGRLASTLHLLIRDRALDLPDDAALLDELASVRLRETSPGVVRLDHDAGHHDDRAVALALASQHLLAEPGLPTVRVGQWNAGTREGTRGMTILCGADEHTVRLREAHRHWFYGTGRNRDQPYRDPFADDSFLPTR
jgi:hypothetical protein